MSNNLPATMTGLVGALETAVTKVSQSSGDVAFLKLLKEGIWVFGADEDEVSEGSLWAVNPESFMMGFQAWGAQNSPKEGELLGEEMALVSEPPILKADLPTVDEDGDDINPSLWRQMLSLQLACVVGDEKGKVLQFSTTSKGGIKAVNKLMQELVKRIKDPKANGKFVPVVTLDADFYKHKKYGRIYNPIIKVEKWLDFADVVITSDEAEAPEEAEADAPEQEPEVIEAEAEMVEDEAEEAPKTRRRRRRG